MGGEPVEFAQYLVQLVLRLQLGASFNGHFYIKSDAVPADGCFRQDSKDDAIWWGSSALSPTLP